MTTVIDRLESWQRATESGHRRPPETHRRRRFLAVLVGGWALFCAAQLALSYRDAQSGMQQAVSARQGLAAEGLDGSQAEARLDQARRSFQEAHRRAASPVLAPVRVLPVVGRQVRSFAALTDAAGRVAGVAAAGAEGVRAVLGEATPTGADRVRALRSLADEAAGVDAALGHIRFAPEGGLLRPLRRQWVALEHDVASSRATLRSAARGLSGVASVLHGPRRYLLLAANNAEMRAGSGMFLSVGTIQTAGGSVGVGPLRPSGDLTLTGSGVQVDGDLRDRWDWLQPGREWRNLATTPRFDATAPVAVRMWESLTGEKLDGALALDVPLLAAILSATGPLAVGDSLVDETNVVDRLLHTQYEGVDVNDPQAERRDELGAMAAAVVRALETGDYSPWRLATALARASHGRHVLAWSGNADDQRTWESLGVAGSLNATALAVNVLNRGGNKLDPFLAVEADLEVQPGADATEVSVRLKVANHAPLGQSSYVTGPHPRSGVGEGDYLGILAINVPGTATDVVLDGTAALGSGGPDGPTRLVAATLLLSRGEETTVTVRFRLPSSERSMEVVPSARVPAVRWESGPDEWRDDVPKVVSWRWD